MCWYGIKKWKNVLYSSSRIVRLTRTRSVRCYECGEERRGVFGGFRLSHFLQSGEEESQWGWCVVSSFAPPSLSFSLRTGVSSLLVSSAFFWSVRCQKICLLCRFSLLIGSNWVFFVFYREGHGLAEKLLLIIFIFWQISTFRYALILCTEAPFSILKKVSAPIASDLKGASCNHYFVYTIN